MACYFYAFLVYLRCFYYFASRYISYGICFVGFQVKKCQTIKPDDPAIASAGDKWGHVYLAESFIVGCLCLNQYSDYQLYWMRAISL
jgi:hypothetical protein